MSAHPEPRRRMRALRASRSLYVTAVLLSFGVTLSAHEMKQVSYRPYGILTVAETFYCAIALRAAHSYNSTLGVRPTPCRQETRIGGRVDTLDLRCAPMTWTKPEFEVVAVTMEITAYSATR